MFFWIQNYKRSFATSADSAPEFELYYSNVGTSGPWTDTNNPHYVDDWNTPIRMKELSGVVTKRYWKIVVPAVDEVIQISGLWLCYLFELDQGRAYPDDDTIKYHDSFHVTASGRIYNRAINRNPISILPRTYRINDSDKLDTIQDIFNDTRGRRYPLFLQEGTGQGDAKAVHIMSNQLQQAKIDYQLWTVMLPLQEIILRLLGALDCNGLLYLL